MDFIVELLKEIAKAIVREISAFVFKRSFLKENNEKTNSSPSQAQGWFSKEKITCDNRHPDGSSY